MEKETTKEMSGDGIKDAFAWEVGAQFHEIEFTDVSVRADLLLHREVFIGRFEMLDGDEMRGGSGDHTIV